MSDKDNRHTGRGYSVAALFVRRPVLASGLNLLLIVVGVCAFMGIAVSELQHADRPGITIRTSFAVATP